MEVQQSELVADAKPQKLYRCRKCRRIVAAEENVIPHEPLEEARFKRKKAPDFVKANEDSTCSSIFVQPMKWMQTVDDGVVKDKIWCLGCKARLGYFNWAGMQCNCGAWVIPAFQLHKCRIDECTS